MKQLMQKEIACIAGGWWTTEYFSNLVEWSSYYIIYEKCRQEFLPPPGGGINFRGWACFVAAKTSGYFTKGTYQNFVSSSEMGNNTTCDERQKGL